MDLKPNDTQDNQQPTPTNSTSASTSNKKILYGILAAVGALLVALIILVAMLLNKDKESDTTAPADNDGSSSKSSEQSADSKKKIVKVVPTSDDKLEYVIYEPKQTATGTTINFGVRNKCNECESSSITYSVLSNFDHEKLSFLLDDNAGKKYGTLKDADGKTIATPNCGGSLKAGEVSDCFVTYAKVPSGSTVSWVFGNTRIDGIEIK